MSRALLAWLVFLLLCGAVEHRCGHTAYDHRASRHVGCTQTKEDDQNHSKLFGSKSKCQTVQSGCMEAATLRMFSPRALSDLAGLGGPFLTWIPMLLYRGDLTLTSKLLTRTMIWYLSVIGSTRHLHQLTGGWDPSGHAIVYGAQLAPLWQLWEAGHAVDTPLSPLRTLMLIWLWLWAGVLCYLSGMTALAFHTLSETMTAGVLVLALAWWLQERGPAIERRQCVFAAIAWAVPTGWSLMMASSGTMLLIGYLGYDLAVWLCCFLVLGEAGRERLVRS
jgi:hypothetical protein